MPERRQERAAWRVVSEVHGSPQPKGEVLVRGGQGINVTTWTEAERTSVSFKGPIASDLLPPSHFLKAPQP